MINLPDKFCKKMQEQLKDDFDNFLLSYNKDSERAIRVNEKKIEVEKFLSLAPFYVEKIPYSENGFYLLGEDKWGKHAYHHAGLFYMQEPSSMIPVSSVIINSDDYVIDLCAAPGGKSGQIAQKLSEDGLLISNEIVTGRSKILFSNIERQGLKNVIVLNNTPKQLADKFGASFDKVFVDAPCSGEGMFRKDEEARQEWSEQGVISNSERQISILDDAKRLVNLGGKLIYSTCTFSIEEDERVVKNFLENNSNFVLVDLPESVQRATKRGLLGQEKCGKFFPHNERGEGQFVAVFEKIEGESKDLKKIREMNLFASEKKLFEEFQAKNLLSNLKINSFNNSLYVFPKTCPDLRGLNVVSVGVKVGEIVKNRFLPFHSLFNAFGDLFKIKLNYKAEDENIDKYLTGHELECESKNGYGVVCVDGFPLGGVKISDGVAKNLYPKGLRN